MNLGIPWVMCKQDNAPGNIINACNGRHCGDTFPGPKRNDMPSLWTENWTTQYVFMHACMHVSLINSKLYNLLYFSRFRVFGDPTTNRRSEDIAFAVSRFFSKNGSHVNYYMVGTLTSSVYLNIWVRHLCFCVQYHGGTNFGRTSAHFVTTRYYDHAPLDEYGNFTDPHWKT